MELPTPLKLRSGFCTDTGPHRKNNEDLYLCDEKRRLFAVCDGMGGQAGGERASAIAIETLDTLLTKQRIDQALQSGEEAVNALLTDVLLKAHHKILEEGNTNDAYKRMGSTATVALLGYRTLYLIHVGDCRLYLLREGEMHSLTKDHSLAASLVEWGNISASELKSHPMRSRLVHYLGSPDTLEPYLHSKPLHSEDRILLCSDGLWEALEDEEIERLLQAKASPTLIAESLVEAAKRANAKDNITTVTILS